MKKSTIAVIIAVLLAPQFMLSSCKKSGEKKSMAEHQEEMIQRSFEASKKVAAAKVNGETITMFTLFREMNAIGPQYLATGAEKTPELDERVRKDALNNVIFQELGIQAARKLGMKVSPDIIDSGIKKIKAGVGSEDAYRQYLAKNSMSEDDLRKSIERDALFEMIATREIDEKVKIKITDADLRARYKREKNKLTDSRHKQMSFEAARGMIEQKIKAEAAEKRMREWEKELKKDAKIEILIGKGKQG